MNDIQKSLASALTEQIGSLKPVQASAARVRCESVTLDGTEATNETWRRWMESALADAKTFEIHCWAGETEWITLALNHGMAKPSGWNYGTIAEGPVTPEFISMVLSLPKPEDRETK